MEDWCGPWNSYVGQERDVETRACCSENKKVHNPIPLQRFQSAISPGLRGKSTKKLLAAPGESNDGHPGTQAGLSLEYMNTIFIDFCS